MSLNTLLKTILASCLILLHSCFWGVKKNLDNLKKCKFELTNLQVHTEASPGFLMIPRVTLIPIVSVTNPNEEDVDIYQFNLKVSLITNSGIQPIGFVLNRDPIVIPKNRTLEFPLALEIEQKKGIDTKLISLLLQLVSAAAKAEEAEILVEGDIQIHSTLGNLSLPVSETRKIKLQK